ncbi:MAG TPA: DUF1538 domain-containing protein [Mollicutes bacterium]|nr:DUF1538 domain-containing protein [Mollicutes bacterium]
MSVKNIINDVVKSVLPLTIVMVLLQFFLVDIEAQSFLMFVFGVLVTIVGFSIFMIGVDNSLIALGELAGKKMIQKSKIWFVISLCLAIGFAITVAEPGVILLSNQLNSLSEASFVNKYILIIAISLGVGIYLGLSTIRLVYKIPLRKILTFSYILVFILAFLTPNEFIPVAFDAGGVTTGPTTVPFILSFGVGIASIKGTKQESSESFGFVGLASIGPILAVLILGVIL